MRRFMLFSVIVVVLLGIIVFAAINWQGNSRIDSSKQQQAKDDYQLPKPIRIRQWVRVPDFPIGLAVADTVFWDDRDTVSLRKLIRETDLVKKKTVMEIGTGSGLLSLCCLRAGAKHVVATDVNPNAKANAVFNAKRLDVLDRLDARLVPLDNTGAFSVIGDDEKFDLIISNPPWENDRPRKIDDYAFYDVNFALMKSLLAGAKRHLNPGGKILLAYGCVDAIRTLQKLGQEYGYEVRKLDDRNLDDLEEVFLPGMLLEIK